jgi:adenine phosphoribosyltransferase
MNELIKSKIRTIPNWPKQGVMYRDITTLLKDPVGFKETVNALNKRYKLKNIDVIVGIEARGFIVGSALAYSLGGGFVPIRKKGKLPFQTIFEEYDLEYGKDVLEIHIDAIKKGSNVLIFDDLLATGGTMMAAAKLVERLGGKIIECCFIVDLPELGGKQKLEGNGFKVFNLVDFEGE